MVSTAFLESFGALERPSDEQGGDEIGNRSAHRLRDILSREQILLLLEGANAEHQTRHTVVTVDLQDTFGQAHGLVDLPARQHGDEGAVEELGIARIGAQGRAVIG